MKKPLYVSTPYPTADFKFRKVTVYETRAGYAVSIYDGLKYPSTHTRYYHVIPTVPAMFTPADDFLQTLRIYTPYRETYA